jgi:hypothetical protein
VHFALKTTTFAFRTCTYVPASPLPALTYPDARSLSESLSAPLPATPLHTRTHTTTHRSRAKSSSRKTERRTRTSCSRQGWHFSLSLFCSSNHIQLMTASHSQYGPCKHTLTPGSECDPGARPSPGCTASSRESGRIAASATSSSSKTRLGWGCTRCMQLTHSA